MAFEFGVIEGFFGRPWSWEARAAWAPFLKAVGGQTYLFAPKAERALRRAWREPIDQETFGRLAALRQTYARHQVGFGVGLTPFDVQRGLTPADTQALEAKLAQLNALHLDALFMLFDDMRGDIPGLAQSQLDVVKRVADGVDDVRLAICPTYYSDDPILERVFGARPPDYFDRLREGLPSSIDVLWTGPQVCSPAYDPAHLEQVAERFGRKVLLWDNFPTNDSARLVSRLHIHDLGGRDARLKQGCKGQLMNPMNQPFLSRITVAAMARVLRDNVLTPRADSHGEIRELANEATAALLIRDAHRFATEGLDTLTDDDRARLLEVYRGANDPMAREVVAWLEGEYAFDPACLTD